MSKVINEFRKKIKGAEVIYSDSYNPWYNLALEEYLFNNLKKNEIILYLWQNEQTVVIGRDQNAWKECNCKLFEAKAGKLARRSSGGGAVYHDLGNLNFTFIMDKNLFDIHTQLEVILKALKSKNIEAEFSGRNVLIVKGKKFSGNAYYYGEKASYHHGTVMVNTDFEKMIKYLQVSAEKIKSKGIESVKARVINLKELNSELSIENIQQELEKQFKKIYQIKAEARTISP
jgi:lipoate-protein ligase A